MSRTTTRSVGSDLVQPVLIHCLCLSGVGASVDLPCGVPGVWQWCQNPQYWIKLPSDTSGSGRTVDLKLVVRRTDKAKDTVKSESVSQPTDNHQPLGHCSQSSKHPLPYGGLGGCRP